MKLYHFTSPLHLPYIKKDKELNRGDIPLSFTESLVTNGVWLTSEKDPKKQSWHRGEVINKYTYRITLELDTLQPNKDDNCVHIYENLYRWDKYVEKNIEQFDPMLLEGFKVFYGDTSQWWVCLEPLPLNRFITDIRELQKPHVYSKSFLNDFDSYINRPLPLNTRNEEEKYMTGSL